MAGYRNKRYTIYDAMEDKGIFAQNTANSSARDEQSGVSTYAGPVEYPKMLYHPKGEQVVIVPAEIIETPMGPKRVGEQRELVYQVVESSAQERALRAEGWHDHPAKAIAASGGEAPPVSADQKLSSLQEQIKQLQADKADAEAKLLAQVSATQAPGRRPVTLKAAELAGS